MIFRIYLAMWASYCVVLMTSIYFDIEARDPYVSDAMRRYPVRAAALLVAVSAVVALAWPVTVPLSIVVLLFRKHR